MAHTDATTGQALQEANKYCQQHRIKFIFLMCYLQASRSAALLHKQFLQYKKRNGWAHETPLTDAIWDGHLALHKEAEVCAQQLTARGQLLYAFEGTTVLQGGAP